MHPSTIREELKDFGVNPLAVGSLALCVGIIAGIIVWGGSISPSDERPEPAFSGRSRHSFDTMSAVVAGSENTIIGRVIEIRPGRVEGDEGGEMTFVEVDLMVLEASEKMDSDTITLEFTPVRANEITVAPASTSMRRSI